MSSEVKRERGDDRHRDIGALVVAGVRARKIPVASVHTINANTIAQLQFTPKRMPAMRPSVRRCRARGYRSLRTCGCDLSSALRHDGPVLASLLRGVFDDLPTLLRWDALPAPLGLQRECDELPRGHPRHVHTTGERAVGFRPRLDDPDAGTNPDQAEQ
jgi:hypothetical protein